MGEWTERVGEWLSGPNEWVSGPDEDSFASGQDRGRVGGWISCQPGGASAFHKFHTHALVVRASDDLAAIAAPLDREDGEVAATVRHQLLPAAARRWHVKAERLMDLPIGGVSNSNSI